MRRIQSLSFTIRLAKSCEVALSSCGTPVDDDPVSRDLSASDGGRDHLEPAPVIECPEIAEHFESSCESAVRCITAMNVFSLAA